MIYKICERMAWQAAVETGVFSGAEADLKDGFIHLSGAGQVRETAEKHFAGQTDLLLIEFDDRDFGNELKWEISRGGDRFPHLYAQLDVNLATQIWELKVSDDGKHLFPDVMFSTD